MAKTHLVPYHLVTDFTALIFISCRQKSSNSARKAFNIESRGAMLEKAKYIKEKIMYENIFCKNLM